MREVATAMYLAFNKPEDIEKVFSGPVVIDPAYQQRRYWGPHAVPDEDEAA